MAEAIIGLLVGRLQEIAVGEAGALLAVNDDIQKLQDRLMWVQALLREVDTNKRHGAVSSEITRVWLHQTREVVFDAVDALDHYRLPGPSIISRYARWLRPILRCVATFTTQVQMRHSLSKKIKTVNRRLDDINENKDKYKMEDPDKKTYMMTWIPSTPPSYYAHSELDDTPDSNVVIYVEELKKLEEVILFEVGEHKEQYPIVISVSGQSGIGKTTLARAIYNRIEKTKEFDVQVMHSFAPYLTAIDILRQIVKQLTDDDTNCPIELAREMLPQILRDKKYLVVIDGEVSGTEWKKILASLPVGTRGTRVVRITQAKPEEPPSRYHHVTIELKKFEVDAAMALFRRRLPKHLQDENFKVYQKDICQITQGLPLAVVLLSGILQTKEFPGEWVKVFDYLKSKQSNRLDNILSVCLEDLPYELKCCFLYFAALPTNTIIEARNMVYLWVADAEGFMRPQGGKSMEKIGYIYMTDLIDRNLVEPVVDDGYIIGNLRVTIHNKVHDYLRMEAHETNFLEVRTGHDIPPLISARRLSLQNYTDKYAVMTKPIPKLRSFFSQFEVRGYQRMPKRNKSRKRLYQMEDLFHVSVFLRVINLEGIEIGQTLTNAIGNVVHLQYLGITSCSLMGIPPSIGRLTKLQTMDVRDTNVRKLPRAFWMINTLRHVLGVVLKLPKQIGNLDQLYTLDSIHLGDSEPALHGTLGELIHLEYLSIWHISYVNVEALSGALEKLECLTTLILQGEIIPSNVFTTFSLQRLRVLSLSGDLQHSSDLDGMYFYLPNLLWLNLEKTYVTQEFINKLAELQFLATLVLYPGSYKDKELVFSSSKFQRLRKFKIIDVEALDRVEIDVRLVPELIELEIRSHHTGVLSHIELSDVKNVATRIVADLRKENAVSFEIVGDMAE